VRSKIFRGQLGRQVWEVREEGKFWDVSNVTKFGRSGGLNRLGGWKRRQDPLAANKCVFATTLNCVSFRCLPHRQTCPKHYRSCSCCSNTY
jgi:hypothetical protein